MSFKSFYLQERSRHKDYLHGVHTYPGLEARKTPEGKMIRDVAYDIKDGKSLNIAAPQMANLIKKLTKNPVLIPIPNSKGDTKANRQLIAAILPLIPGATTADILSQTKTTASHDLRKTDKQGKKPNLFTTSEPKLGPNLILIDNVITTGNTIFQSHKALKNYSKPIGVCWAINKDTRTSSHFFELKKRKSEEV